MPLDPTHFLRALNDPFTPVRDTAGNLLGCVPKIPETADTAILGTNGAAFAVRIAAQVCICADTADPFQHPSALDGFIPIDDTVLTRRERPPSTNDGEDPDLAVGV